MIPEREVVRQMSMCKGSELPCKENRLEEKWSGMPIFAIPMW